MKDRLEANVKAALPSWDRIAGNWKQFAGKARERWGELTDSDVDVIAGRRELLVGKIQERYGIITDQAERQVAAWMNEVATTKSRH
ncbi:CsbD family protein [Ferrovibrio terrae]|uniref:CsbD family protein n=1 Tax=Ferrovibrio terrae TaxID=2594003 RepID=UPI003137A5FA